MTCNHNQRCVAVDRVGCCTPHCLDHTCNTVVQLQLRHTQVNSAIACHVGITTPYHPSSGAQFIDLTPTGETNKEEHGSGSSDLRHNRRRVTRPQGRDGRYASGPPRCDDTHTVSQYHKQYAETADRRVNYQ